VIRPATFRARLGAATLAAAATTACLGDIEVAPEPPVLLPVTSPTSIPQQTIRGTKPKGTAILDGEEVVVPHDDSESWEFVRVLEPGENRLSLASRRESGRRSRERVEATIDYDPPCPASPTPSRPPPVTRETSHEIGGGKPAGTSIHLDGVEIVAAGPETTWSYTLELPAVEATYDFELVARDARDRPSSPVRFSVTLDRTAPVPGGHYPPDGATGVPTNVQVLLVFDEALGIQGLEPDPATVSVERTGGIPVPGLLAHNVRGHSLTWLPQSGLLADTTYIVTVAADRVSDVAGNVATTASPGAWSLSFTTGSAPTTAAPGAPTVDAPASVTTSTVMLAGTRDAWTSIWIDGEPILPPSAQTTWSVAWPLSVGPNQIAVASRSVTDQETAAAPIQVERVQARPDAPTLAAGTPATVDQPALVLSGGKPANTAILLDGNVVVCEDAAVEWGHVASLTPGFNDFTVQALSAEGVASEAVRFSVNFAQDYAGPVPSDYTLQVYFSLRDLSQAPGVSSEFETGANNYGIDVWLEGPLEDDETCVFLDAQRQDVEYVATIEHYIGTKEQHKVPFADEDYRGADYLAALISGGVFEFMGLAPDADRRDAGGREIAGLMAGVTEQDLRDHIDCLGVPGVDTCTSATTVAGPKQLPAWTPRARDGMGLLAQGNYLLQIQINLDRDPGWLGANDYETCWGSAEHAGRGMHRITQRVALGATPYSVRLPQSAELSGPDLSGSEPLRFIGEEGVTLYWGP
jgi:hypothetical protein